ncbi:ATP-binding cassette domain-containing protein [Pimelobacter simplex]|uniref:ABC transporter ATP-binding protein n=1 Tax=Nocardioides simplex TaxID=2045 RepID=UPI0008E0FE27|nr:ATP-binding cassette domain-containing protein [Pimelobacter simplex]MCG8148865.1 ATP-binding cassette domain-containing protein [Pimelobacter simplex]GEB14682.1 hypothetical protein NSI01_29970 [Pimelobacter simplex]SFM26823.1 ABC-2 type transport system ATP-binding protein [Pimelobacter simplex]
MELSLTALRCRYPGANSDAVHVDELVLGSGVTGLVGVNGAGKSTLLATLAGARRPQGGSVTLGGQDLYGRRRIDVLQSVGYMPQTLELPAEMATGDALTYFAWLRGVPAREAGRRASALLEKVELSGRRKDRIGSLSGGMQRRLAFAASLVTNPLVLLLDEPTTGLDPEQRANLRRLIQDLPSTSSVFISSHVMEDVEKMTTRLVVLAEGRVLHHGPTKAFVKEHGGPERSAELAFLSTISKAVR